MPIHLTHPRGEIVCGATSQDTTADITFVTCAVCYRLHEAWVEAHNEQDDYEDRIPGDFRMEE